MCLFSVTCVFSAKFGQFREIKKTLKPQEFAHMKCNGICDFWSLEYKCRQSSWTMVFSLETFFRYFNKNNRGRVGKILFRYCKFD